MDRIVDSDRLAQIPDNLIRLSDKEYQEVAWLLDRLNALGAVAEAARKWDKANLKTFAKDSTFDDMNALRKACGELTLAVRALDTEPDAAVEAT